MGLLEAIILGIIQGLTEFLPVSSSGHLEIGSVLLNIHTSDGLLFTVVVHAATAQQKKCMPQPLGLRCAL